MLSGELMVYALGAANSYIPLRGSFDLADIYGLGLCESIFGQVLTQVRGMRDQIVVISKCGIRKKGEPDAHSPYRYDFPAEHINTSCEGSLSRLGIDHIDLYLLDRPDYLANWEEVAGAF
jgi:predicted oxidoreductase